MSLWALAMLMDDVHAGRVDMGKVSAEVRQHSDRHGLSPKSMLQLRWVVAAEPEAARPVLTPDAAPSRARRDRLRIVDTGGAA